MSMLLPVSDWRFAMNFISKGCTNILIKLFSGHHPFVDAANDAAVMYRLMQGRRPALRSEPKEDGTEVIMPDHVAEVVDWCWKQQPSERPDIMDVVQIMKTWEGMVG
jgi:hypothetical protein